MLIEWKNVFLFAILPAIVAGIFSIAPKLYDIATEPKSELVYSVITGPQIEMAGSFQQIISIQVKNSGKNILNNVQAMLVPNNGLIISKAIKNPIGNKPVLSNDEKEVNVFYSKLHSGEVFSISALIQNKSSNENPIFSVRSDEVLGEVKLAKHDSSKNDLLFPTAFSTIASVLGMALFFLSRISNSLGSLASNKSDAVFYIAVKLGLHNISDYIKNNKEITFMKTADLILLDGLKADSNDKDKYITALKLLLFVDGLASVSKKIILLNIKTLSGIDLTESELCKLIMQQKVMII